ncbi:MAG: tagaturonate epimerase family protein [Anaerolineales bacterium]
MLHPFHLTPTFGFGDRLGLEPPGHIAAVRGTNFAPSFAQQSARENTRTGRTPQQVMTPASA